MKLLYLAGSWRYRDEVRDARDKIEKLGYVVTSRWLDQHEDAPAPQAAKEDLEDIDLAEALILFTRPPTSGGRENEFGYALCAGKDIYIVGQRRSVFHSLVPEANMYKDLGELLRAFAPCQEPV